MPKKTKRTDRSPASSLAPFWLPAGARYDGLSPGLKSAIREILTPAYRQLVLDASDPLERAAGISLVHTLWMELYDQDELAEIIAEPDSFNATLNDRSRRIRSHLDLVAAKSEVAQLLGRLRAMRLFLQQNQGTLLPAGRVPIELIPPPPAPALPPS